LFNAKECGIFQLYLGENLIKLMRGIIRVTANKEYMMLCGPSLFIEMANHAIGARLA
jgi:hypothetical protein